MGKLIHYSYNETLWRLGIAYGEYERERESVWFFIICNKQKTTPPKKNETMDGEKKKNIVTMVFRFISNLF